MSPCVAAYAKLNLSLRVLGVRRDGHHEIDSEVQTIDLADRITIEFGGSGVHVECRPALDGENLAERAALSLLERKRCKHGARIHIVKTIPIGAGLGGGSSDAAAVLDVLDRLTPPRLPVDALCEVGSGVGSDVALFLYGGRMRMRGRGERVEPLRGRPGDVFVVLVPPVHCATGAIYDRWDVLAAAGAEQARGRPDLGENDLLRPALDVHPALVPYHAAMGSLEGEVWGMSGSGSSFYAAFDAAEAAEQAAGALQRRFDSASVFVCRPTDSGHRILEAP